MSEQDKNGELDDNTLDNINGGFAEGGCVIDDPNWPMPEPDYRKLPVWEPYPLPIEPICWPQPEPDPYPLPYYEEY
jgi:hypothetical protein